MRSLLPRSSHVDAVALDQWRHWAGALHPLESANERAGSTLSVLSLSLFLFLFLALMYPVTMQVIYSDKNT